jgi:hypothetical protein
MILRPVRLGKMLLDIDNGVVVELSLPSVELSLPSIA